MPVRPLRLFPDPSLSQPCRSVANFGEELRALIRDLTDSLWASPGVGLAAPQIGILECVSVIDVTRRTQKKGKVTENHGLLVLVNPVLVRGEGRQTPREGCLSVPDLLANVSRYERVTVKALNPVGKEVVIESRGFEALALQHEIDHLNGKLFMDRVSDLKTDVFRRQGSSFHPI